MNGSSSAMLDSTSLNKDAPRIAVAGSVSFTRVTLEGLLRHHANVVGVLGLSDSAAANVSDYARMDDLARSAGIPYADFTSINDPAIVDLVRSWSPDILFVIGSQLVRKELMSVPRRGCVSFHPTALPRGRGRAPVAWLTWDGIPGAATFFQIDEGVDTGPILVQESFPVGKTATSTQVVEEVRAAIGRALDRWVPRLNAGEWKPEPQDESKATYNSKRTEKDGLIDWRLPATEIDRLIRTAGRPYPGAYTFAGDSKVIIWRAEIDRKSPHRGVIGRVLEADGESFLVQTGDGLLRLREIEILGTRKIIAGTTLGYSVEDEIYELRRRIAELEAQLKR